MKSFGMMMALVVWLYAAAAWAAFLPCEPGTNSGKNLMELRPANACVHPGTIFRIWLHQRELQELVQGYQAFLQFDPSAMEVIGIEMGPAPYGWVILKRFDNVAGTIDLAAGIDRSKGQEPTREYALLAEVTFIALGSSKSQACFREYRGELPSYFTGEMGKPVYPDLTEVLVVVGLQGDLNCDGRVDFNDINPFVMALSDPAAYKAAYPDCEILNGDMNCDGVLDFDDINAFVDLLKR